MSRVIVRRGIVRRGIVRRGIVRRGIVRTGAALAISATLHSILNVALLRRPPADPEPLRFDVSVLIPARDEQRDLPGCLESVLAQAMLDHGDSARIEVIVVDDGSHDSTAAVAAAFAGVRVLTGAALPEGWLGKPHACAQLAAAARPSSELLVFLDADVRLAPKAITAAVELMTRAGLDFVSPYPRQLTITVTERLIQPLLQWSWLTTLPLRVAERSSRLSMATANGQFLLVRRDAYERAGGHAAVRGHVLEDVELARRLRSTGHRGGMADGSTLARCRMYHDWGQLRDGYGKSLWAAFGSPTGAAAVLGVLTLAYVVPPLAALGGSRAGLAGYLAAVLGRAVTGRATGARVCPDAAAHPVSVLALALLTARSLRAARRGTLTWRGRPIPAERAH